MLQSSSSEKKLVKPLKIAVLGHKFPEKGLTWASSKIIKKNFVAVLTKADHQLPETFYFMKISYVLADLQIS